MPPLSNKHPPLRGRQPDLLPVHAGRVGRHGPTPPFRTASYAIVLPCIPPNNRPQDCQPDPRRQTIGRRFAVHRALEFTAAHVITSQEHLFVIRETIENLAAGRDLSMHQMAEVMDLVMRGQCSESEVERFLLALRQKGESVEELAGAAAALRRHMTPIQSRHTAADRHVRHWRGSVGNVQHQHGRGAGDRRRRRAGGQARQSQNLEQVRVGGRAGGTGGQY